MSSVIRGSDNFDSAVKSGTIEATASGALANGDLVVVNSDGTVSTVLTQGSAGSSGSKSVFNTTGQSFYSDSVYDSANQKVVIVYSDVNNGYYGEAVVGTVSGTSISFGTPVVFNTANTSHVSITYDSVNQKVVVAYRNSGNSSMGTARVGTVSGTSISFGSAVVFETGNTAYSEASYDVANQKVVISYVDVSESYYGKAVVGAVSGTSISFGTPVNFNSGTTYVTVSMYDPDSHKIIIAYDNDSEGSFDCRVGTVSGTSISFGTPVTVTNDVASPAIGYHEDAQKVVIAYSDRQNSYKGTAIVGTVSGTSISFGTPSVFYEAEANQINVVYDTASNKIGLVYRNDTASDTLDVCGAIIIGTSISFSAPEIINNAVSTDVQATYDPINQKVIITLSDSADSYKGTAIVHTLNSEITNLSKSNYIGISDGNYADGATAKIQVVGSVDDAQSGLSAGTKYYVQLDSTLGERPDTTEVFAGTAVSATELIIKG